MVSLEMQWCIHCLWCREKYNGVSGIYTAVVASIWHHMHWLYDKKYEDRKKLQWQRHGNGGKGIILETIHIMTFSQVQW